MVCYSDVNDDDNLGGICSRD